MQEKIEKYMKQDIDHPTYLFHGSNGLFEKICPHQSADSDNTDQNIANAVFLFPSFLKATPYAFMNTIIDNSEDLPWEFDIPNRNEFPIMSMKNVNLSDNMMGYVYVFTKTEEMIKDPGASYQYNHELTPIDIVPIFYKDFKKYYQVQK